MLQGISQSHIWKQKQLLQKFRVHKIKSHQDKERRVLQCIIQNTQDVLTESVAKVKEAYIELYDDEDVETDCITVSYEGSWQKRSHTSLYGVAAVINVLTGLVIDYEILS